MKNNIRKIAKHGKIEIETNIVDVDFVQELFGLLLGSVIIIAE
jgi:hypothetical protein